MRAASPSSSSKRLDAKQDGVPPHGQRVHGMFSIKKSRSAPRPSGAGGACMRGAAARPGWLPRVAFSPPGLRLATILRRPDVRPALHQSYQHPHIRGTHATRVHHGIDSLWNSVRLSRACLAQLGATQALDRTAGASRCNHRHSRAGWAWWIAPGPVLQLSLSRQAERRGCRVLRPIATGDLLRALVEA